VPDLRRHAGRADAFRQRDGDDWPFGFDPRFAMLEILFFNLALWKIWPDAVRISEFERHGSVYTAPCDERYYSGDY
jgi:hypothetical protein